jgi:hypothetical protein
MTVFTVSDDEVWCRQSLIVPDVRIRMVQIEYQPGHHSTAVNLHIGIANGIRHRSDNSGRFVVTASRQERRFAQQPSS